MKRLPGDLLGYFFGAARAERTTTLCDGNETPPPAIMSSILTHKKPTPPLIGSGI